ncbi:MAG: sugar phosphate isomerase/epimerase [Spirochaetia bacterium]|nr:sugar phosphate isomerase/epimerase [Spirochaetia bacterium]
MYGNNKIGICAWSLPIEGPYACKLASEIGLDGIQLDIGPYERGFPLSRDFVQQAYVEAAAEYGISYPSMAARVSDYYSMVSEPGEAEHEIVKQGIEKAIEACGKMNIPVLLIPNFEKSAIKSYRDFDIAVDVMKWACELGARNGVTIAAENTLSIEETVKLLSSVDKRNFKLYFDFQNYYLHKNYYSPDILEALMPHVVELHVKDGKNRDLSGALLGKGDVNFSESMDVLRKSNYSGWVVTENYYDVAPLCGESDNPVELIKQDLSTIKRALS